MMDEDDIVILAQHGHGIWPAEQARELDPDALDGDVVKQTPQLVHRIRGLGLDGKSELCGKAQATHDAQGRLRRSARVDHRRHVGYPPRDHVDRQSDRRDHAWGYTPSRLS